MIFKLSYNSQTHLYNKSLNHQNLINYTQKIFTNLPTHFTFIYMSSKGQMTYIQSDADLIGLKYICSRSNDMIIKLHIIKTDRYEHFGIDDDIHTQNIVKKNIQDIADNVFTILQDQSQTQAISEYLQDTYTKVSEQVARAEEQTINKEVNEYLFKLYQNVSQSAAIPPLSFVQEKPSKQQRKRRVRFSLQRPRIHCIQRQQKTMQQLVNEKVLFLLPGLVDKIYSRMQSKMSNRCRRCIKKEMEMEWVIDEEINRRMSRVNVEENPEEES